VAISSPIRRNFHDFPFLLLSFRISVFICFTSPFETTKNPNPDDGKRRGGAYDGPMWGMPFQINIIWPRGKRKRDYYWPLWFLNSSASSSS
jgi:uncharacterized membrane protein YhaH (DUF805 family)